jgi:hypothetical protein
VWMVDLRSFEGLWEACGCEQIASSTTNHTHPLPPYPNLWPLVTRCMSGCLKRPAVSVTSVLACLLGSYGRIASVPEGKIYTKD